MYVNFLFSYNHHKSKPIFPKYSSIIMYNIFYLLHNYYNFIIINIFYLHTSYYNI